MINGLFIIFEKLKYLLGYVYWHYFIKIIKHLIYEKIIERAIDIDGNNTVLYFYNIYFVIT